MLRRAFGKGLRLGLFVAAAVAVVRRLQRRDAPPAVPAGEVAWPPIPGTTPVVIPPPPTVDEPEPERVEAPVAQKQAPSKKAPAKKAPTARKAAPLAPWVDPVEGVCPTTHPVKAKRSSKLFHLPGMLAYERTKPDRCYLDEAAAEADGFTKAKR